MSKNFHELTSIGRSLASKTPASGNQPRSGETHNPFNALPPTKGHCVVPPEQSATRGSIDSITAAACAAFNASNGSSEATQAILRQYPGCNKNQFQNHVAMTRNFRREETLRKQTIKNLRRDVKTGIIVFERS